MRSDMKTWTRLAYLALLVGTLEAAAQIPPGFELVRLTEDPDVHNGIPDINNASEIIWSEIIVAENYAQIMLFSRGIIRRISTPGAYDLVPAINDASQLAWISCSGDLGPWYVNTNYTEEPLMGPVAISGTIDLSNFGDLIWVVRTGEDTDVFLYSHDDDRSHVLTNGGDNQSVKINDLGQQVTWRKQEQNPDRSTILVYSDGEVTEINPACVWCQDPDINDLGHMVWQELNEFLTFWDGQSLSVITSIVSTPKINNVDEIAFAKWFADEQLWKHAIYKNGQIYVLPNFGMTNARRSLNDRGEIAMRSLNPQTSDTDLFLLRRLAPKGDCDHDCRADMWDRAVFENCFTGRDVGPVGGLLADCARADFDEDGDVDLADLASLEAVAGGPGEALKGCEP
jgi:hypothetical protein